ncbi:Uma2 family endonuclease [Okeania sp. SIO2C2]|uniref:Uma2 family endonuclease n=1 Tax=Okeania sp. SIO2C2 TaxID=2607787 RepID=UPI00338FB701
MLWQEYICPLIVLEFVSGDGTEERDKTPPVISDFQEHKKTGKFWVYEQRIRIPFYGIYEVKKYAVELYSLTSNDYEFVEANERSHFSIPQLGIELGICHGRYNQGNLLLTGEELAQQEYQRAERLAEKLCQIGINLDQE